MRQTSHRYINHTSHLPHYKRSRRRHAPVSSSTDVQRFTRTFICVGWQIATGNLDTVWCAVCGVWRVACRVWRASDRDGAESVLPFQEEAEDNWEGCGWHERFDVRAVFLAANHPGMG